MKYKTVSNPIFSNPETTMINVDVDFDHLGAPGETVPFTAAANDTEAHGREIYERAINGEFGPVAPYVAPIEVPKPKSKIELLEERVAALEAQ